MFDFLYSFWSGDRAPRRLELLCRIPPDAPVFALMLLRRRRDILRFGITEP